MRELTFSEVAALKGNGSSMRTVLKWFFDQGARVYLIAETNTSYSERFFLVKYKNLEIPLRSYNLNFYSVFNSMLGRSITRDKLNSYAVLKAWNINTPETMVCTNVEEAEPLLSKHSMLVVKPSEGSHGDGITTGINEKRMLESAFQNAKKFEGSVLIQQQVVGEDYRLLYIDYKFVAAVKRVPATIVGDGTQTVRQLVEASNKKKEEVQAAIELANEQADSTPGSLSKTPIEEIEREKGSDFLDQIPAAGEEVKLLSKANVSLGGQAHDVTDQVNKDLAESLTQLLRKVDLPICGVDVISGDISGNPTEQKSFVIELNAAPGLRLHERPFVGQHREVCAQVAELLVKYYEKLAQDN